jgi:hypothetical protein
MRKIKVNPDQLYLNEEKEHIQSVLKFKKKRHIQATPVYMALTSYKIAKKNANNDCKKSNSFNKY